MKLKDEVLFDLADEWNIVEFVSISPEGKIRYNMKRIQDHELEEGSTTSDTSKILEDFIERNGNVNIRTFKQLQSQGNPFIRGIDSSEELIRKVKELNEEGYYCIINPVVPIAKGQIDACIYQDGHYTFSPGNTPRGIEDDVNANATVPHDSIIVDFVSRRFGTDLNKLFYGKNGRFEFTLLDLPTGIHRDNLVMWEHDSMSSIGLTSYQVWPSSLSKFIGDKLYGLLVAHDLGCIVPRVRVYRSKYGKEVFSFGQGDKDHTDLILRPSPPDQEPGLIDSIRGPWSKLSMYLHHVRGMDDLRMTSEQLKFYRYIKRHEYFILQDYLEMDYSGAYMTSKDGSIIIEGVRGDGSKFMTSEEEAIQLPESLKQGIIVEAKKLNDTLGAPTRGEWGHLDGQLYLLQLHMDSGESYDKHVYLDESREIEDTVLWIVQDGLDSLRCLITAMDKEKTALEIKGNLSFTSHAADILRKEKINSYLV